MKKTRLLFLKPSKIKLSQFGLALVFSAGVFSSQLNAQASYTFTSASATGSVGPTQAQLNSAYASTNLNGLVVSAAGIQTWTVPATGVYAIDVAGASGGGVPASLRLVYSPIKGRSVPLFKIT